MPLLTSAPGAKYATSSAMYTKLLELGRKSSASRSAVNNAGQHVSASGTATQSSRAALVQAARFVTGCPGPDPAAVGGSHFCDLSVMKGDAAMSKGDTAMTKGDAAMTAKTKGDAATTKGDTAMTKGDAATTKGDTATTKGDAATTKGDAAMTKGDTCTAITEGAADVRMGGVDDARLDKISKMIDDHCNWDARCFMSITPNPATGAAEKMDLFSLSQMTRGCRYYFGNEYRPSDSDSWSKLLPEIQRSGYAHGSQLVCSKVEHEGLEGDRYVPLFIVASRQVLDPLFDSHTIIPLLSSSGESNCTSYRAFVTGATLSVVIAIMIVMLMTIHLPTMLPA